MTTESPARSRTLRRVRRAGLVALASLVAYVLIGLPFFVFPGQDPLPKHADVAFVLGPAYPERLRTAERLREEGVVDEVLVSILRDPRDFRRPKDERDITPDPQWVRRCAAMPDTTCRVAKPYTTQGEARMLERLAEARGWDSAIVITQAAHLDRSRTIMGRCFDGRLAMRDSGEGADHGWPYQYVYQTVATLKAWFVTNTC